MSVSVVIRTCNEAPRLRLTLESLCAQPCLSDIVVIDDGSTDDTAAVLAEAGSNLPLVTHRHEQSQGRSAASNAGAALAKSDILLFLDGDTVAGPELFARHAALHASSGQAPLLGRGEVLHLRCTRFFHDPELATPQPDQTERVARMPAAEREAARVTRHQIREDFGAIARRAQSGVYPGAGPRRLIELEEQSLRDTPGNPALWVAATGSNFSVPRQTFLASGGFRPDLDCNEHRELAYRLVMAGAAMRLVEGGRSYHLTHRSGWRDPLVDRRWETIFSAAHPKCGLNFLMLFWASLSDRDVIPPAQRITSLAMLEAAMAGHGPVDEAQALALVDRARPAA